MTETEFGLYLRRSLEVYAGEWMRAAGMGREEALELAEKSFSTNLPKGIHTENHFLFCIVDRNSGVRVGDLWFAVKGNEPKLHGYLYEIWLDPEFQGRGYGKEAMLLLEAEAKKRKLERMGLHVFTHNPRAISLYEKLGYETTSRNMSKSFS